MGADGILVNASSLGKSCLCVVAVMSLVQRFEVNHRSGRYETIPHSWTSDLGIFTGSAGMSVDRFRCVFGVPGVSSPYQYVTNQRLRKPHTSFPALEEDNPTLHS